MSGHLNVLERTETVLIDQLLTPIGQCLDYSYHLAHLSKFLEASVDLMHAFEELNLIKVQLETIRESLAALVEFRIGACHVI